MANPPRVVEGRVSPITTLVPPEGPGQEKVSWAIVETSQVLNENVSESLGGQILAFPPTV
jgi:hypothetical protein